MTKLYDLFIRLMTSIALEFYFVVVDAMIIAHEAKISAALRWLIIQFRHEVLLDPVGTQEILYFTKERHIFLSTNISSIGGLITIFFYLSSILKCQVEPPNNGPKVKL